MNLKNQALSALTYIKKQYHCQEEHRSMRNTILRSKELFPPLTSSEKQEIHAYWNAHGFPLKYTDTHRVLYGLTGVHDFRFVPPYLFFDSILPKLNNISLAHAWEDKAYLSRNLQGFSTPKQVLANIHGSFYDADGTMISASAAREIVNRYPRLVFKPTILSGQGRMVSLVSAPFSAEELFARYGEDFSVQLPVRQCGEMAQFNPSSVNTVRMNSLLWDGSVYLIPGFMRVGEPGAFADNQGEKRYFIGVHSDGTLGDTVVDHQMNRIPAASTGLPFTGFAIPNYEGAKKLVTAAHLRYPHFRIISWDICIDEHYEPTIIEVNLSSPGFFEVQMVSGIPLFGDLTEDVLSALGGKKK